LTRYLYLGLFLCSGCALLSKSEPFAPRYFSPEQVGSAAPSPRKISSAPGVPLRLGAITSGSDIRENLVFRSSSTELGFSEERWTERPESYLRRALSRALFEERGLQRVISGRAATVDVELAAFEEVLGAEGRARMTVVVILHDEHLVLLERTLTVERAIVRSGGTERNPNDVVKALSEALAMIVDQIAETVLAELARSPNERSVAERTE
jgi:hypothetical protein